MRNKPVTTLGYGLDETRLLRVIVKRLTQFGDAARQHIVGDKGISPNGPDQLLFGYKFSLVFGQAHKHLHHLGLQPDSLPIPFQVV
jgi:hypothetical protein